MITDYNMRKNEVLEIIDKLKYNLTENCNNKLNITS